MKKATKKLALVCALTTVLSAGTALAGCGAPAKLVGSYNYSDAYIWYDAYVKNLIGVKNETLSLYDNGTYTLSYYWACVANMDTEIVTGAKYDPFYSCRIVVEGSYETTSEADEFGTMEIVLKDATLVAVNGNFDSMPGETDGEYNFDLTINQTAVVLDVNTLTVESEIVIYQMKA